MAGFRATTPLANRSRGFALAEALGYVLSVVGCGARGACRDAGCAPCAGNSPRDCHQRGGAVPGAQDHAAVDWSLSVHSRDFRGRAGPEAIENDKSWAFSL